MTAWPQITLRGRTYDLPLPAAGLPKQDPLSAANRAAGDVELRAWMFAGCPNGYRFPDRELPECFKVLKRIA